MKKYNITATITIGLMMSSYAQTNRINHYSHSGTIPTMDIFKANDHMGLNCGSAGYQEFTPDTTGIYILDSVSVDSTKPKVCTPNSITTPPSPRRGLSLERIFNAEDVLKKF